MATADPSWEDKACFWVETSFISSQDMFCSTLTLQFSDSESTAGHLGKSSGVLRQDGQLIEDSRGNQSRNKLASATPKVKMQP